MNPATNWQERVAPDETERFERHAATLRGLQQKRAKGRPVERALHAKGVAGLQARFTVLPDLPAYARVGLFAQPATFRAYVRFSNGAGARTADTKPDVRGLALKLVGVAGKKLIPELEDAPTQDFLLIRSSSTPFRDADEFVQFVRAAATPALLLPRAFATIGFFRTFQLLKRLLPALAAPMTSLATTPYFSALPIRFGDYAVRYALFPRAPMDGKNSKEKAPDFLAAELAARLGQGSVEYDFRIQFFVDEARTPIEDPSLDWSEADAPYLTVGRLTLFPQDLKSVPGHRIQAFVETLSFDPWHALEEFRPLGAMMRARNHAYRASTQARQARAEPDGSESFD